MRILEKFSLQGKTAIVTGGGRGIGLKMAEALAEAGANLVLCSRKLENCQKAANELSKLGGKTLACKCDVKSPADIQKVVDATIQTFGKLDILVNNSGATWGAPTEDYPLDGWLKVMETNVTGVFLFSQIAGRAMIKQKSGNIINIASIMGVVGNPTEEGNAIAYNTSKGAVITFTKDLAAKWAKYNIRVNAISPGWFPSDMSQWILEREGKKLLSHIPMGRLGDGEDLKGATVFLASDASSYITGTILPVDGGYLTI